MPSRLIAIVFEYATLNGGERSMLASLDWLKANRSCLEFVAIAPPIGRLADALRERKVSIQDWSPYEANGQRRSAVQIEASLKQIVASLRPNLLHANSLAMGRLTGRLSEHLEIPTTTHLRDIVKLSARSVADLNGNRRLIAVSNATRDFHIAQGIDAQRISMIHNGIDLKLLKPRTATGWLHAELGLAFEIDIPLREESVAPSDSKARNAKLIATIGQIGLRKGQVVLAAAAPSIIKLVPNAHFLIVGERTSQKSESIEYERAIYKTFAENGIAHHLHALPYRDDIPALLNEIDLLVHPANQEPFGRVLLEAAAAGVPVVATNVGGTAEIIIDRTTGRLVSPRDPQALAVAAIELLTNNLEAQQYRTAARERAVQEFAIAGSAERLGNLWSATL